MKTRISGKGELDYGEPKIMGILNLTPDSFSDGGQYSGKAAADHIFEMIDDGADIIDIGGESSRPGSSPISVEDEIERVIPFLKEVAHSVSVPISIDTYKPEVAELALDAGADIINDITGFRNSGMMKLAASADVPTIIMHMHGKPKTMQTNPIDDIDIVISDLRQRKQIAEENGVKQIIIDPGIGFGKTMELNNIIVDNSNSFSFGCPILIGASRKSFLKTYYPGLDCDEATDIISKRAVASGANILRVHNVKRTVSAIRRIF